MVASVFGAWDYAIMAATMVASIAIGLYFRFSGGKQATNEVTSLLYYFRFLTIVFCIDYTVLMILIIFSDLLK